MSTDPVVELTDPIMTPAEIEKEAARRYLAAAPCHPTWSQLSDCTKGVWREIVVREAAKIPKTENT